MRMLVFCVAVAIQATGCAMLGWSAASRTGAPLGRFYLTRTTVQGNKALDACARGFHMASRFELLDLAALHYDAAIGVTADDSGSGPPSHAAAYGSGDPTGWVRTGGASRFADTTNRRGSAFTNCAAWSINSAGAFGTVAYLTDEFTANETSPAPLWNGGSERCDVPHHVWCIQDRLAEEGTPDEPTRHRRGRREGAEDVSSSP